MDAAVLEQLDVHFLVDGFARGCGRILPADDQGGLIEEDILGLLAFGELVAGAGADNDFFLGLCLGFGLLELGRRGIGLGEQNRLILDFEKALGRPGEGNGALVEEFQEAVEIYSSSKMGGDDHRGNTQRTDC